MLKFFIGIAISAVVILLLSIAGISYFSSPPSGQPSEQQTAAQAKTGEQSEKNSPQRFMWFPDAISVFTFWLTLATIGLVVVAALQIWLLMRSERISAQAADAATEAAVVAKSTLIVANRPWIAVDASLDRAYTSGTGFHVILKVVLNNTGHSPARRVQIRTLSLPPAQQDYSIDRDKMIAEQRKNETQSGIVVHPGVPLTRNQHVYNFGFSNMGRAEDDFTAAILVCVTYDFEATGQTYVASFILHTGDVKISAEDFKSRTEIPGFPLSRDERYDFTD